MFRNDAGVLLWCLLDQNFERFEVAAKTRALNLRALFAVVALRDQNQPIRLSELSERLFDAVIGNELFPLQRPDELCDVRAIVIARFSIRKPTNPDY